MDMPTFARRFRESFPDLGASNPFLDRMLTAIKQVPHLDVIALDDAIIAKHGEYPDGVSCADFVASHYGAAAAAFVREAI